MALFNSKLFNPKLFNTDYKPVSRGGTARQRQVPAVQVTVAEIAPALIAVMRRRRRRSET